MAENPDKRPGRTRFTRYLQSAERTPQWPRRLWVLGQRLMPVQVHIHAIAKLHRSMQKRIHQLEGQLVQVQVELAAANHAANRTQKYIQQMHGRIDQAGGDGLTVAQFIEQEHERVRAYRKDRIEGAVVASEPGESDPEGWRAARGALVPPPGAPSAEEAIRKGRGHIQEQPARSKESNG